MKIYNTQSKTKENFVPIDGKKVKMYVCGPTVYDRAHIGNLRTYINTDLLRRSLEYLGYEVNHVMNITDIEDKIIKKSLEKGVDYTEITKKYEKAFFNDLEKLNIKKPKKSPHATDSNVIKKMVEIIESLIDKGIAYISSDGSVYFSIDKFLSYGKLSHLDKEGIKPGMRCSVDEYDKDNVQDFALWKKSKKGEPSWEGPKGIEGRPGWHIECSAMSMLYLGETIDIHAGGVDLIFPHHENEIAQSEAYTGKTFVNYWFHCEHLLIDGKRMGKSENNFYSIDEMAKKFDVEPLAFRLLAIQSHYRDKLNFTKKSIKDAQNTLNRLRNFINRISQSNGTSDISKLIKKSEEGFKKALSDDLGTPKAMAEIFDFIGEINKIESPDKRQVLGFMSDIDKVLGLDLSPEEADEKVQKLFTEYQEARKNKNWKKSDKLREEIKKLGWETEDSIKSSRLVKRN